MSTPAAKQSAKNLIVTEGTNFPVGCRVKQMNCHAGLIIAGLAVSGLHHEKNKCTMTITSVGVYVQLHKHLRRDAHTLVVPWANIYFTELLDDAQ